MSSPDTAGSRLLHRALTGNAAFSALSGMALLTAPGPLGAWIGVQDGWILRVLGVGLVGFGVGLFILARSPRPHEGLVVSASVADFAWVGGSVLLLVAFPEVLTAAGSWAVGLVAVAVAAFGSAQLAGLRRSG